MIVRENYIYLILLVTSLLFVACKEHTSPRPYSYFRIDLPENEYENYDVEGKAYQFEKSIYSTIIDKDSENNEQVWGIDIVYPDNNAIIHCSYYPVKNRLFELLEESRSIVYKHSIKADAIGEISFDNDENRVHAILYELKGDVATPFQFVLTDSNKHFMRAALYFENTPNSDSIQPVVDFIQKDIIHLIESFNWKYN